MLKCFDLTEKDLAYIQEIKNETGAGSAREVVRRAIEEYREKIFAAKSASAENYQQPQTEHRHTPNQ